MAATFRNLAVVIGINTYRPENGIKPLGTAANDARAIAQLLKDEYKYFQIWELYDEQATYEAIKILLNETLPKEVRKSDRLLFYFAGHGITRKGKDGSPAGYLIPQNAKVNLRNAENDQSENFLPMQELYDAFKTINCHHLLVILDCCYAGMFRWATRKLGSAYERIHQEHYARFIRYPAWQVIASAAHDQEALDLVTDERGAVPGTNHSPFALALLQGLGHTNEKLNADLTEDGVITTPELYFYVDKEVNRSTSERQTPGFWSLRHEFDRGEFIFVKPGFDPKKNLTPAPPLNASNNPYRGLESFEERHARFFFGRTALVEELSDRLSKSDRSLTIVLGVSGSGKSSLVKARLLVKGQEVGEPYVEPAHDFLVRGWNKLQQWINRDKEDILLQRELTQVSNRWVGSKQEKQSKGFLWIDDPRLPRAMKLLCGSTYKDGSLNFLKWLSGTYWKSHHFDLSLNADEEEFVKASFDRKNQGFRNFVAITVGIILGLSALLVISQVQRKRSVLREKVASVNNLLSSKPTDALILAIQGIGEGQSLFNKIFNSHLTSELEVALKLAIEAPKEKNIFRGANNPIQSISIHPNGESVIIGRRRFWSGTITSNNFKRHNGLVLWNLKTNTLAETPSTETTLRVKSVAFSPTGQYVVLARHAAIDMLGNPAIPIALWNLQDKSFVKGFREQKSPVNCVAFSSDGQFIVSGDTDNYLSLWNLNGSKYGKPFKAHTGGINSVAVSYKYIISGGDDRTIRLWDFQGKLIWAKEHDDAVRSVTFSRNGQYIASSSNDGTVRLWDLQGNSVSQPFQGHEGIVYSVAFSPNGRYIISGGADKTVRLWDLQGNLISQPFQGHESAVTSVTFSTDGDSIISGSQDGTVRVWNVYPNSIHLPIEGHIDAVLSIAFSPDGKYIASGSADKTVRLWTLWGTPKGNPFKGHTGAVKTVVFNPVGKSIASGDNDATIWLWNYQGQPIYPPIKNLYAPLPILSVFFSSNGQQLLRFSSNKQSSFYDNKNINCDISWINLQGKILGRSSFSNDSCDALTLHSPFPPSEKEKLWLSGKSFINMGSFSNISILNLKGDFIKSNLSINNSQGFRGHNGDITSLKLSPNGEYIISGGNDATLRLWNVEGEAILQAQPFIGHTAKITFLDFSLNSQYIVSGSADKTVRLWDLQGKLIATFEGHKEPVTSAIFSPSGDYILSSSMDGKMQLWLGSQRIWLQEACTQLQNHADLVYAQNPIAQGARQTCLDFTKRGQDTALTKQLSLFHIISTANFLAKAGDLNGAINEFQKAITIAPDLDFKPRVEATRIATLTFIEQGRELARANKVQEAIDKLNTILKLKPDIDLDPRTNLVDSNPQVVALRLSAMPLLEEGQNLALIGNVKGAVNKFNAALKRDPSLKGGSGGEDFKLSALSLVVAGQRLAKNNRLSEAFSAYAEALKLDPSLQIPAEAWNSLCWYGSLYGHAIKVMNACQKAVVLEPQNGEYRDSRGVARALTGNILGAIDDFQAYMQSTGELVEEYHQRKSWISMLRAGKNPFTPEEINKLLNQ